MEKIGDIKAKPMTNLERGQFNGLDSTLKLTGTQIVSDIFHVKGNFQFVMPCMVHFQLKVEIDEKLMDLKAVIRENGDMKQIDAHYQDGYVTFSCKKTDLMYIVSTPKVTNVEITELNEYEYASDADETIRVNFPLGSVSEPTPVSFKVIPPNEDVAQKVQSTRSTYAILAISKCLCVESKGKDLNLKKKATLQLPINIPDDTDDYELTLFVVKEDSVEEVKASINKSEGKALSSEVSTMKTMVYALMKNRTSLGPTIYNEILYHLGKVRYYKLLTFRDKKYPNVIWVECCPLESVQAVIQKRRTDGYILERHGGESNTLCFRQNQKIRAEVGGKIAKDSGIPPSKYLITVLFDAEDKVAYFPFVKKATGSSANAVVKLVSDNFQKGKELWSLFFDPDRIGR
ncbi:hypothetical protein ACJMK2_012933 [Sinanodonta woodiana]|uniref:Uncharacterized protein n=1 Tax=Sinanodonta woodiana TaxID=1069815 RepID=A0ABD3V9T2_SINWO